MVRVFDGDINVEGRSTRAPGDDVKNGILVLAGCVGGGEGGDVHLTPRVEVAVTKALEKCIDDCRVEHFASAAQSTDDGMCHEGVEGFAT